MPDSKESSWPRAGFEVLVLEQATQDRRDHSRAAAFLLTHARHTLSPSGVDTLYGFRAGDPSPDLIEELGALLDRELAEWMALVPLDQRLAFLTAVVANFWRLGRRLFTAEDDYRGPDSVYEDYRD